MYLLYIDASGTPELQDNTDVYAVVGIAVQEGSWFALDRKVRDLKSRYGLLTTGGELHAKDFCVSINEQAEVVGFEQMSQEERRDNVRALRADKLLKYTGKKRDQKKAHFRNTNPFVHLTRQERSRLLEDALDLIGGNRRLHLFGEAITKSDGRGDVVAQAFEQVVTRFEYFLDRKNRTSRDGYVNKGLLVMDQEPSRETTYRRMLDTFRNHSHGWGGHLRHVIEAPFFVESHTSGAVQLADIAAYALRRYLSTHGDPGSHEEANFLRIYDRFDRQGRRLHGLRHFCTRGTCTCAVCRDRGHGE